VNLGAGMRNNELTSSKVNLLQDVNDLRNQGKKFMISTTSHIAELSDTGSMKKGL
jgi:hypothetical protein